MRKKLPAFITAILLLFTQGTTVASEIQLLELSIIEFPKETAILSLPDRKAEKWKEISYYISKEKGLVERIPMNQTVENWSELIRVQFFDRSQWKKGLYQASFFSIPNVLERLRDATLERYPGSKVSWRIIERNKKDAIYEWILHKPHEDIPAQHEIARIFLTKTGLHSVGFTHKSSEMSADKKRKWVKLLQQSASVVPYKEAFYSEDLSLTDRLLPLLDLASPFESWRMDTSYALNNGTRLICCTPQPKEQTHITESIEIFTLPLCNGVESIDEWMEFEKKKARKETSKQIEFQILKQSPKEIIYTYNHPKDRVQLNAVVRVFFSDRGYYSISYKHEFSGKMQSQEIAHWQHRLESIKLQKRHDNSSYKREFYSPAMAILGLPLDLLAIPSR